MKTDSNIDNTIRPSYSLYVHTNMTNGKQYCGVTCQIPEYRWREGGGYTHNTHFQRAIQKYGWDRFSHEIIADGLTQHEANIAEQEYIREHNLTNPEYGYNQTLGGEGAVGYKHTDEAKTRMSECRTGHVVSEETKAKIGDKNRGKNNGMYSKRPWNKGVPMTSEVKGRVSENRIGKTAGENHPMYGKHHTEETKRKISASHIGKATWNKGIKTGIKPVNARAVSMMDDYGNVIMRFESLAEAASYVKGDARNIGACCRKKVKHAYSYSWSYAEEDGGESA